MQAKNKTTFNIPKVLYANNDNSNLNFTYNFNNSSEGFIVNKTDIPINYSNGEYEVVYELEEIPIEGNKTKALSLE